MGLFKKIRKQFLAETGKPARREESIDDDLRKLIKRLPNSTKRNLLEELGSGDGGSVRMLKKGGGGGARRASEPAITPITEEAPVERVKPEVTAQDYAVSLLEVDDLPELKEVKALHKALKEANEDWVERFRTSGGMGGIYKAMAELAESREEYLDTNGDDENEHEVPEEEIRLEEELVHCVMVLLNKPQGLITLEASSDLLPLLAASAIDSSSNYVRCNLLKLLTIVAESGPNGFDSVMNALDHVKVDKDADLRFAILVETFGDADSSGVALVTDLIVFFNTVLSSAFEFEERVMLRTEMIQAGILEAMQRIRDHFGLSKMDDEEATEDGMEGGRRGSLRSNSSLSTVDMNIALDSEMNDLAAQLDLFDTVMNEDLKDAKEVMGTGEESIADEALGALPVMAEAPPDPPAVEAMRNVMAKLEGNKETRAIVEVIASNMERMVIAHSDPKHWKKIRDATSSAFESNFMDSDDEEEDDDDGESSPPALPPTNRGPPPALPPRTTASPPPPAAAPLPVPRQPMPPVLSGATPKPIPPAPALPGVIPTATPPAPALPGVTPTAIPPAPALPGVTPMAIPPAPALPGVAPKAIPLAPALPGVAPGAVPPPPALPNMPRPVGVPLAPPLPGLGRGPPMPPPLPIGGRGPPPLPMPPMGGLLPVRGPPRGGPALPTVQPKPKGPKKRGLHWQKLSPTRLENTVFSEIDPSSVDLPMDLLADAFVEKPKEKKEGAGNNGKGGDTAAAAEAEAKKKAAAKKVEILDGKTLRNNGIVFKRFRTKPHALRDQIVGMQLDDFDVDKLIALRGIAPTPDDLPKLKGYDGDLDKLDEVSLFMVLTARIPRYQARLDCALFMKGFGSDADFLSGRLGLVGTAVKEVKDSPRLKRLIEVVIAMGNYLNEGTSKGEAKGIALDSLLKLNTVKTMDKKKTLLHVLTGWAKDKEPDLLQIDEDLVHASEASQWSLTDLKKEVTQVSKGFTLMQGQLKMAEGGVTKLDGDKFTEVMKPFLEGAKDQMEALEAEYTKVQADYDATARRFGEEPTKVPSGEFFALVSSLVDTIAVALRDNELQAKAEERRRKREAQEKKRRENQAKKQLAKQQEHTSTTLSTGAGRGLVRDNHSIGPRSRTGSNKSGRGFNNGGGVPGTKPFGMQVNQDLLKRRMLIAADSDNSSESDSDDDSWKDEDQTINNEYDRIKTQRVSEAVMLKNISKLKDPSKREIARGQLPYQKSTIGRQSSMARQRSGNGRLGSPAMLKQVSAVRQASNLRALSAVRQASTVGRGLGRNSSVIRPSPASGTMRGMGGLSTGRLDSQRFPNGRPGLSHRQLSRDEENSRGEGPAVDPRKQFHRLKSTAFLA